MTFFIISSYFRPVRTKLFYLVFFIFLVAIAVIMSCNSMDLKSVGNTEDSQPAPYTKDQYMGAANCASCHQKEYNDWLGSHHDLAMQTASDSSILGDFNEFAFESNGVPTKFFKKEGKYFVNTESSTGEFQDFEVKYTFGVTPLQQYMVEFPDGRVQCLLTAWNIEEKKWFDLVPDEQVASDDWLHWTGGSMTWNAMCADCHSTFLEKNFDEEQNTYDTQYSIINVSCEACHGPGKQHIDYINSKKFKEGSDVPHSYLQLTENLSNKQQVDQCGRCHARRGPISDVFDHSGTFMDHYLPEILRPGMYHPDGQILEEVYVYGSFLQSKMYRHNVKCTDCHNAHSMELLYEGNQLCTQCHVEAKYDDASHHFHTIGNEGANCIDCHMPGKFYMGNDFRRDHSFRVPRPDLSVAYDTPNACNNCHQDRSAEWASEAVNKWYGPDREKHFSDILIPAQAGDFRVLPALKAMIGDTSKPEIVQATAVWLIGQMNGQQIDTASLLGLKHENAMIRFQALNALDYIDNEDKLKYIVPLLRDSVKSVRTQAAYVLANFPERLLTDEDKVAFQKVDKEYLQVLAVQADFPLGQMQRGQYYQKKNNNAAAEKAYKEALRQDPYFAQAHFNLANLYYLQNKWSAAISSFNEVIQLQPNAASAYYSLSLLHAEMQDLKAAEKNIQKAAELSMNPRYYYNWGLILQNLNRNEEAEKVYLNGLKIDSQSEPLIYALAIFYLQQQRITDARPLVQTLLQLNPNHSDYLKLLPAVQ